MNYDINWLYLAMGAGFLYWIIKEAVTAGVFNALTKHLNTENIIAKGIEKYMETKEERAKHPDGWGI